MTDLEKRNRAFNWCTLFFRELHASGVRHAVISPGSRSTPLTLSVAAYPGLQKHVVLDERSAGFTALGIGKATGKPAVLICTSGTAAAHYYAAIIEAKKSWVPLITITADRPSHLRGTDANQTINQLEMYGSFPVFFYDISEPGDAKSDSDHPKQIATQAFDQSITGKGPVHLNIPFSKPLEPDRSFLAAIKQQNQELDPNQTTNSPADRTHRHHFDEDILNNMNTCKQPLIIVGQLPVHTDPDPIFELARHLNAPVLSEQSVGLSGYAIQGFEGFLRNKTNRQKLEPDLILRFGLLPASKSLLTALNDWKPGCHVYVTDSSHPIKTSIPSTHTTQWNGQPFDLQKLRPTPDSWLQKWKHAGRKFSHDRKAATNKYKTLTDGHVYELLAPKIPADWTIFFSNSFPVRDRSLFGEWGPQHIFTNRGASGIDGITSTAFGVNIGLRQPGILFTGDLAFLHDTNALLHHKLLQAPMIVVVINNDGGSIFRMLPIAELKEYFTPYFETPQQADISGLVASYGIDFTRISTPGELKSIALTDIAKHSTSRLHIIECQTDPALSMQLRKDLWSWQL